MAERVRVRGIDDDEGRRLLRIIRRGTGSVVTWRRAQMVLLSAQGRPVAKIAKSKPAEHGLPFSTWSLAKLTDFLVAEGVVDDISHEGLRVLLREEGVSFQRILTFALQGDDRHRTVAWTAGVGAYELDPFSLLLLVGGAGAAQDEGMKSRTTSRKGQSDPVAESVAIYSGHADDYAAVHAPKMADRVERFAGSLPVPSLILDAGCGPGRDLARFRKHGHVVRGVDLNPVFVAMANAHAPTSECDLREVGSRFPAGTFDGIWASASLVHLDVADAVDVLGQFAGLLRPEGRMYVCLSATGSTGWLDEPDGRRWYTVWDPDELAAAVAGAGFTVDGVDRGPYVEVWATRSG